MASIIKIKQRGSFSRTELFFNRALKSNYLKILEKYGQQGVQALMAATPVRTGKTAESWSYGVEKGNGVVRLYWDNNNLNDGVSVVILIVYGHGLQNGGYVQPNDFVTPALQPIFDQIANDCWKEVTR